jgi:hypothetical protein
MFNVKSSVLKELSELFSYGILTRIRGVRRGENILINT